MFTCTGSKGIRYLPLCFYPCRSVNSPITGPIESDSILCMNTSQVIYCSLNSSITFFFFTVLILKLNLLLIKISCWQWLNAHKERLLFICFSMHSQFQAPTLNKRVFQYFGMGEREGRGWGWGENMHVFIWKRSNHLQTTVQWHFQWHYYFLHLSSFSILFTLTIGTKET